MYPTPTESSSEEAKERFEKNRLSVTRQVHYNVDNPAQSVDMVLFLNGLPIVTLELKNRWTNQNRAISRAQTVHQRQRHQTAVVSIWAVRGPHDPGLGRGVHDDQSCW